MLVTNNTSNYYYLGDADYALPPGGAVTVPDDVYNSNDDVADAINQLDVSNSVTVSSAPSGYPRTIQSAGGGGGAPSGAAGGDLGGTYPNPTLSATSASLVAQVDNMQYESRSSNTILGVADKGKTIDITAAITQTFEADETLGDGWWVILRNATTNGTSLVVLNPAGSETIDGLATVTMYSGETRLVLCNGTGANFNSKLLQGGYAKFTVDGNFVLPSGIKNIKVVAIGAGGSGGGGRSVGSGWCPGGSGGGGGGFVEQELLVGELMAALTVAAGDNIAVTVGTATTGGSAQSTGNPGSLSSFGAGNLVNASGGGGGFGNNASTDQVRSGGGGGGGRSSPSDGAINAGSRGSGQLAAAAGGQIGFGVAGGGCPSAFTTNGGGNGQDGGAAGGFVNTSGFGSQAGYTSIRGGGGGGGGGGNNGGTVRAGGTGGRSGVWGDQSNGDTSGVAAGTGQAGNAGQPGANAGVGSGGGGGGGATHTGGGTGGTGGAGGSPGGGGGGGGGGTTGGVGGAGGRGEVRVWYS